MNEIFFQLQITNYYYVSLRLCASARKEISLFHLSIYHSNYWEEPIASSAAIRVSFLPRSNQYL